MLKRATDGICAALCIACGGAVFLSCEVKYVGAVLFSVALLCICMKGYNLFTGKVGYMAQKHDRDAFSTLLLGLLGNAVGTVALGFLLRCAIPVIGENANTICTAKLGQSFFSAFVRAFFCGVLMFLAVSTYREKNTCLGILFCIPVFILSGFEHSIADMFYFAASGIVSARAFFYLWIVILGNSAGSLFLCALSGKEKCT